MLSSSSVWAEAFPHWKVFWLSLAGLCQSECSGQRWSDRSEKEASRDIARALWKISVRRTKNIASEATIPPERTGARTPIKSTRAHQAFPCCG
jgi:hypothetical protein